MAQDNKAPAAKTKKQVWADRDIGATSVVVVFKDGSKVEVKPADFSTDIRNAALLFGFSKRIGDVINRADSVAEAKGELDGLLAAMKAGTWVAPRDGLFASAVVNVMLASNPKLTEAGVRARLSAMQAAYEKSKPEEGEPEPVLSADEKKLVVGFKTLKGDKAVKAEIGRLMAERNKGVATASASLFA